MPARYAGAPGEGRDHDDFVVTGTDLHAHTVILPTLLLAQGRIRLRIEEIRVRIQHAQHARNRPVVNRLIGVDGLGIVLLDDFVNLRKAAQAVADVAVAGSGG